jgi:hypothetical protein
VAGPSIWSLAVMSATIKAAVIGYAVGFIAAQYWTVWLFRDAMSAVGGTLADGLTARYFVISILEAALAIGGFVLGLRARDGAQVSRSPASAGLALIAGIIACSISVGAWPLVPRLTQGDLQVLLQATAGAIISYVLGWAISRFSQRATGQ